MSLYLTQDRLLKRAAMFEEVVKACRYLLQTAPEAEAVRNYADSRISKENQELFHVGYFPDQEHIRLLTDLVDESKLHKLGLLYRCSVQHEDVRVQQNAVCLGKHNLTLPYRDFHGNTVALVGRTILSENDRKSLNLQKYHYTRFRRSLYLFGLHQAKRAILKQRSCILVEGQIDCISMHEAGIHNCVALGGVAFTQYQSMLIGMLAESLGLLLDNDAKGQQAQNRIASNCAFKVIRLALPPSYKDIDAYIKAGNDIEPIVRPINNHNVSIIK